LYRGSVQTLLMILHLVARSADQLLFGPLKSCYLKKEKYTFFLQANFSF
jgi:hypothetical protein